VQLWLGVLSGPLQTALNSNSSQTIRSTICDCLSNVGQNVFVTLPVCVFVTLLICVFVTLSVCVFVTLLVCVFVSLPVCIFVILLVYVCHSASMYLFVM